MPLKKSKGNMYEWVTHQHCHLGGECPHKCSYCYVESPRFGRAPCYSGPIRLREDEFDVKYGKNRIIFIDNCNDLFAAEVPAEWIMRVLNHCKSWPENVYVFQTKNPYRYLSIPPFEYPQKLILGTTIETNRDTLDVSMACKPILRMMAMEQLKWTGVKKFVTIEPILDFDLDVMVEWMKRISPTFVNIGADSKGHALNEPTRNKVFNLVVALKGAGIDVMEKHNLGRLLNA